MKWIAASAVVVVALCILALQWEQLATLKTVAVAMRSGNMTDPGPLELKASWIHTYDSNHNPIYHEIVVTRNAPSETITAWEQRFKDTIATDLADPDTRPVQ